MLDRTESQGPKKRRREICPIREDLAGRGRGYWGSEWGPVVNMARIGGRIGPLYIGGLEGWGRIFD